MKTTQLFLMACLVWIAAASAAQAQVAVRVTADRVNLRARPQLENSEVLAQAAFHDVLQADALPADAEWIAVLPPDGVHLWISQDLVQQPENLIKAQRVNVRAGPSISYNVVDTIERGTAVAPLEELSGWLKIAPPASTRVYIHRDFVEAVSPAAAAGADGETTAEDIASADSPAQEIASADAKPAKRKPRKKSSSASAAKEKSEAPADSPAHAGTAPDAGAPPVKSPLATPIVSASVPMRDGDAPREIPVPPPANLKLIPLQGQGKFTEMTGELRAAPLINEAPSRYRIVRWENNRWQILCHVYGEASKLRSLQDKQVRVAGHLYWIQGAAAPVLVPNQIQEIPGTTIRR